MSTGERRVWPRRIRRLTQGVAFLLFLAFVVFAGLLTGSGRAAGGLMRLSPLSGVGASLSSWNLLLAFWPAAVLLLGAVLLGRYFCGWACPLGTTLDVFDRAIAFLRGGRRPEADSVPASTEARFQAPPSRRLKYYLLAVCLLTALFGFSLFGYFDPLSIAVRSYVLVVHPSVVRGVFWGLSALEGSPIVGAAAGRASGLARALLQPPPGLEFPVHGVTGLVFLGVLALGLIGRRWWCRSLCPLGALYALAGMHSLTARKVGEACIHCGRCAGVCPTHCISPDGVSSLAGECILCLNCQAVCPVDAIRFLGRGRDQAVEVDLTRRGALAAVGAAAASYLLLKAAPPRSGRKGGSLIRPPLAGKDEEEFLQECLRCGQCMRVCPTQVIQPAGLEGGLESLWTPKLDTRVGYCEYECNECGRICPSGAIPRFSLQEKHSSAVGLAYVDRTRCIPWLGWQRRNEEGVDWQEHNCGVCEEVCPVPGKAIHFSTRRMPGGQELRFPYVRAEACVGCGFCQYACPVQGKAAVRVSAGYRELEPPAAGRRESEVERALPVEAAGLRLAGPKQLYEGERGLWEQIDGGADPYLEFNFVRGASATYVAREVRLEVRLWEFETPEDAFGAYAKDRTIVPEAAPVPVGDEGALAAGPSLWARRGRYTITVFTMGGAPPKEVVLSLARATLEGLEAAPAPRPELCRRLPPDGLEPHSVRLMRAPIHLQNIYLRDDVIEAFALEGPAVGAYGTYGPGAEGKRAALVLIQYARESDARDARARYEALRAEEGHKASTSRGVTLFRIGEGHFSAVGKDGRHLAVSLFVPDADRAVGLVRDALGGR